MWQWQEEKIRLYFLLVCLKNGGNIYWEVERSELSFCHYFSSCTKLFWTADVYQIRPSCQFTWSTISWETGWIHWKWWVMMMTCYGMWTLNVIIFCVESDKDLKYRKRDGVRSKYKRDSFINNRFSRVSIKVCIENL